MTVADALNAAADLIETKGWCQGFYTNDAGGMCIEGALIRATEADERDSVGLFTNAAAAIIAHGKGFVAFNDTPGRTAAEVIGLLRDTAKEVAAQ